MRNNAAAIAKINWDKPELPAPYHWKAYPVDIQERLAIMTIDGGLFDDKAERIVIQELITA